MNDNQINLDPLTDQTINHTMISKESNQDPLVQPIPSQHTPIEQLSSNNTSINSQHQIQGVATVEQTKQDFIENTQANNKVKKEVKKDGPNVIFIIILFIIIFASIFFLFPYLMNILG